MARLSIRCECGNTMRPRIEMAGRRARCKQCNRRFTIPAEDVLERSANREVELRKLDTLEVDAESAATVADESLANSPTWELGQLVDSRYQVEELLGDGAAGVVWKVHHTEWDVDLAVKELRCGSHLKPAAQKARKQNFVRECRAWVDEVGMHPHVVTAWYVRELSSTPYLFLEYCDDGDLKSWIQQARTQDLRTALDIAIQLAWGLAHCHAKGVIHRDLKPLNVMMTAGGMAKLTDFGLLKFAAIEDEEQSADSDAISSTDDVRRTLGGGLRGTPAYMPPEQWQTETQIDHRADLYALGVTIHEMLTGQHPIVMPERRQFPDQRVWLESCAEAHRGDAPFGFAAVGVDAPESLDDLVRQCLEKEVDNRPDGAAVVANRLLDIFELACNDTYPRPKPDEVQPLADGLNNQGVSLIDLGRPDEAIARFDAALKHDPIHPEATFNRGLTLWRQGKLTDLDVVRQVEQTRAAQSDASTVEYLLAQVHAERGDVESAQELLTSIRAADVDPRSAEHVAGLLAELPPVEDTKKLEGHTDGVHSIAISEDGQYVISGSCDRTLRLWDVRKGECLRTFEGHADNVTAVALSTDGRQALSGSDDQTMRLWDTLTGVCVQTFEGHSNGVNGVALSSGGRYAVSCGLDSIRLWSLENGECIRKLEGHRLGANAVAVSPDGLRVLSGSLDKTIRLWLIPSNECIRTLKGHHKSVTSVAFSSDGRTAVSGSDDRSVRLWDIATGVCRRQMLGHSDWVKSVSLSADGRYAATGDWHSLRIWNVSDGRCIRTFETFAPAVAMSTDSSHAICGGVRDPQVMPLGRPGQAAAAFCLTRISDLQTQTEADRHVRNAEAASEDCRFSEAADAIRLARSTKRYARHPKTRGLWAALYRHLPRKRLQGSWFLRSFDGHSAAVTSVAMSSSRRRVVTGSLDDKVRLWDAASGALLKTLSGHSSSVACLAIVSDSRTILSGSHDRTLRLWKPNVGNDARVFEGHQGEVTAAALSPRHVVSGSDDQTVRLWNRTDGSCVHVLEGHEDQVTSVAVSTDGRYALSGSRDKTLRLWNVATGKCERIIKGHDDSVSAVVLTADGSTAFSASHDKTIKRWDKGFCDWTFSGHTDVVTSISVSTDGQHVLSGSSDNSLRLWSVASGKCLHVIEGHTEQVWSVALSSDCVYALSGSANGTCRLWFLDWELETPSHSGTD